MTDEVENHVRDPSPMKSVNSLSSEDDSSDADSALCPCAPDSSEFGKIMIHTISVLSPGLASEQEPVFEMVPTVCKGKAKMFIIPDNNIPRLKMKVISERLKYDPSCQIVTFLETRSLPAKSLKDMCRNVLVAFKEGGVMWWKLGIIELLQYKVEKEDYSLADGVLYLLEWTVPPRVSSTPPPSKPTFFDTRSWSDCAKHLRQRMFVLGQDDIEIAFLNQVMGPLHQGANSDTNNKSDFAVQSSQHGPDRFIPSCPHDSLGFLMKTDPHQKIDLKEKDYYITRPNGNYIHKSLSNLKTHGDPFVKKFLNFEVCLVNKSTMTNYVVVANKDGGEVNLSDMQEKLEEMKDMLLLPSLQDSVSKSNPCSFFLIHPKKLDELKKNVHGVPLSNAVEFFDREVCLCLPSCP
jgi:hypothetical protein